MASDACHGVPMGVVEVLDPVQPARVGGWKVDVSRGEWNGRVSSERFGRPDDERNLSLDDFWVSVKDRSDRSRSRVVQTADTRFEAVRDSAERLHLILPKAHEPVGPTHWAFGQLASIVSAPAALPAPLAGIKLQRFDQSPRGAGENLSRPQMVDEVSGASRAAARRNLDVLTHSGLIREGSGKGRFSV